MAGKTGTAQVQNAGKPTAGYEATTTPGSSFAPAERSEIAVVVLVEHGGFGGDVAAPRRWNLPRLLRDRRAGRSRRAPHRASAAAVPRAPEAPGAAAAPPPGRSTPAARRRLPMEATP